MRHRHAGQALLLACVAMLVGAAVAQPRGTLAEIPPDTPETREAERQQQAVEMPAWMARLVGRFRYTGVVQFYQASVPGAEVREFPDRDKIYADGTCDEECFTSIPSLRNAKGLGDCIAIGAGAGVHCVVHVVWEDEWTPQGMPVDGGVTFLGPAATLYGYDPIASRIRYLILNTRGVAESEAGRLNGNTLSWTFDTHCESDTTERCRQVTKVQALPDGKSVRTYIALEKYDRRSGRWWMVTSFTLDMNQVPLGTQDLVPANSPPSKRKR
jgi:hypothetical protein